MSNMFDALDDDPSEGVRPPTPPPYDLTDDHTTAHTILEAMYADLFTPLTTSPTSHPNCLSITLLNLHIYLYLPPIYPTDPLIHIECYTPNLQTTQLVSSPNCKLLEKFAIKTANDQLTHYEDWDVGETIRAIEIEWNKLQAPDDYNEPLIYDKSEVGDVLSTHRQLVVPAPPPQSPAVALAPPDSNPFHYDDDTAHDADQFSSTHPIPPPPSTSNSRYLLDFHELKTLGTGGGGSVYKVRNRLDGRLYAIKKIRLSSHSKWDEKLTREVKWISRLIHTNVVRYYNAWVERDEGWGGPDTSSTNDPTDTTTTAHTGDITSNHLYLNDENPNANSSSTNSSSASSNGGWWQQPGEHSDSSSSSSTASNSTSPSATTNSHIQEALNSPFETEPLFNIDFSSSNSPTPSHAPASTTPSSSDFAGTSTLYIQMEYCTSTLATLLPTLTLSTLPLIYRLTRQLIEGLSFIHKQGVIHRDLKPANVFLGEGGEVRIGDFGLATIKGEVDDDSVDDDAVDDDPTSSTAITTPPSSPPPSLATPHGTPTSSNLSKPSASTTTFSQQPTDPSQSLTTGVGTAFYRAPEIEHQHHSRTYNQAADIFSLGIIIFEMLREPFATYMERANVLSQLRGEGSSVGWILGSKTPTSSSPPPDSNSADALSSVKTDLQALASTHFEPKFIEHIPQELQILILWCTQTNPLRRPSATELLASEFIPQQMALEKKYLDEALQILGNRGSHGFSSVLSTLFTNASKMDIDSLWDSDVNLKCAQFIHSLPRPPYQHLNESLTIHDENNIRGRSWHPTIIAALIQLLKRKKSNAHPKQGENYAFIGDGLTRGVLMSLAGRLDGNVFPCDTRVTGCVTRRMETIFRQHCAVEVDGMILGDPSGLPPPQTLMTRDGVVLGLRDDLTAPLIKVLRRCGGGIDLKHFCIGKVWQGKTNKESYEAEFNVSRREGRGDTAILGAECMGVFSSIFETLQPEIDCEGHFFRVGETNIADGVLDMCGVDKNPKGLLKFFTEVTALGPREYRKRSETAKSDLSRKNSVFAADLRSKLDDFEELTESAKDKLFMFLDKDICPLPADPASALERLTKCVKNLRNACVSEKDGEGAAAERKLMRQFESVMRGINDLRLVTKTMPIFGGNSVYCCVDVGLRVKKCSGVVYSCIGLQANDAGVKFGEGGFYSAGLCGLRVSVNKFVERIFGSKKNAGGNPLVSNAEWGQEVLPEVVVVGGAGFNDSATLHSRVEICSRLWNEGVRSDYMSQIGGVVCDGGGVEDIVGLCAVLRVRFVVVVKSHVYVNTGKVFVRDCLSGVGDMIEMDIKQLAAFVKGGGGGWESGNPNRTVSEHAAGGSGGDVMAIGGGSLALTASVDYFYVENDGFWVDTSHNKQLSGGRQLKVPRGVMKLLSTARKSCNEFLGEGVKGVFVVELPYLEMRDFATGLGLLGLGGIDVVCDMCDGRYGGKKRLWKNWKSALRELGNKGQEGKQVVAVLFHSAVDESVDLVRVRVAGNTVSHSAGGKAWIAAMKSAP